ncbi:uncharacterized protein LOC133905713 [Phragmites australis]|uniref:uncharacterized protein LOC133905713 n=1 Tax=Phragmites australis TaxID=29695 RepID=UPI002D79BA87|nr:uncharacterized protein LOC133905713 [Phragmites australis]
MGQEEATLMPATVVFSGEPITTPVEAPDTLPESPRKAKAPARWLSVPPPPGRPRTMPMQGARSFSRARAVRPEDDPFLAAYLACTKSSGRRGGTDGGAGSRPEPKGRRRFTWVGLGLSCKGSGGAVEQSMVKVAKRPEVDPRDD